MPTPHKQAERILAELNYSEPPVNVLDLADQLGVPVLFDELGDDVSGLLVFGKGERACIVIQKTDHPNRQRFSIAHELGHYILKHRTNGEHVHVDKGHLLRDKHSSAGIDRIEIEANRFAANLLMPKAWIESKVAHLKATDRQLRDYHIRRLAEEFGVSEVALAYRLKNLRLD